ncbi:MAG: Gfo/Idh/MocA family protein [Promethearchaeota archaeon]|jgi:predicted dehydrogenase
MTEPLKIGLIGTGSIAQLHGNAYKKFPEVVKLTAVCDTYEKAVKGFADSFKIRDVYTNHKELLEKADIDAVDICTTHDTHYQITMDTIEAGKHILLEKPMAIKMDHCRELVKKSDRAGLTFMISQNLRYLPQSQTAQRMIKDGKIGDVWTVQSFDVMGSIPPSSKVTHPPENIHWYFNGKKSGGGSLITLSIHSIDLFRFYIGNVEKVIAKTWTGNPFFSNNAEDRVIANLFFKNGAIGYVMSSFTTISPWSHRYIIFGEKGTISSDPPIGEMNIRQFLAPVMISSNDRDAGLKNKFIPLEPDMEGLSGKDPYINEILHFAECCQTGEEPISSGKNNLGTMKTIFGIYKSAQTGMMVNLNSL